MLAISNGGKPSEQAPGVPQFADVGLSAFDMTVLNDLDRFHLAGDAVERVSKLHPIAAHFQQFLRNKLVEHRQFTQERGDDMPEVKNWKWPY